MKVSLVGLWRTLCWRVAILLVPLVRLWRTFGWWALVFMSILLMLVYASIEQVLPNLRDVRGYESAAALMVYLVILAVPMIVASRKYQRSVRTKPHDKILGPLVASAEEYCLLLRPFGSDGEIILPHKWDPWWVPRALRSLTLEQAVALTARESLGLKVYALVDQDRLLAPPGPVYLRSPHDQWQSVTRTLIRRAHSIILILSPGQEMRKSFQWEIEQIILHNLQSRVIIILPPYNRRSDNYSQALQRACVLVATLGSFTSSVADVDPLRVGHWERLLAERTKKIKLCRVVKRVQVIKFHRGANTEPLMVECWYLKFTWWRKVTDVMSYKLCLAPAFDLTKRELAELDFSTRYPWPLLS